MNYKLNLELAKEYYKLSPIASLSVYALVAVTLYFYWGKIPASILFAWGGVSLAGATLFLVAGRLFKRYGTDYNAANWLRIYAYLVLFQDVPLGLLGPMSLMVGSEVYYLQTLFMLGGIATAGIITRALVFRIYLIALLSLGAPSFIILALQPISAAEGMLPALALVYVLFMLFVAKSYSASFNRNILLWLDNEQLVQQMRISNTEIEGANHILTREIEHRKEIERELLQAKQRSERASEAKNQFLANVSHELRTPLNGVMGFADLLQHEKLEQKHQQYIYQISKAAETLRCTINDILDITAIEAGHISFCEAPFSLRAELEDLLTMLLPMAEQKKLRLEWHVREEVEDGLYGDANRLRQIISNLLSNALKYTETGHVSLNISRLRTLDSKVLLRFDIEDTGIGIAADALDSIFDNFTRVDNFETRRTEGVGLGLSIVKTLVQQMNGKVAVRSMPGKGSCFSFELAFAHGLSMLNKAQCLEAPGFTPNQRQVFNVLVVDDNEINRMVLGAFLTKAGIPFSETNNGHDALELIRCGDFNVVLLDIQMPDISGIEVAKRLHAELATPPVLIAVTAHAFPEQRQTILDAGFSDFLIKPILMDDLLMALTQAYRADCGENQVYTQRLPVIPQSL